MFVLNTKQMFFGFVALLWTCVRASFACPNWYAAMTSILLMVLSTFSTIDPITESSCYTGSAVVLSSITSRWQRDAELKNKDAELKRKSRRILELAPTCFIFRSQRNVINHARAIPVDKRRYSNGTTSAVVLLPTMRWFMLYRMVTRKFFLSSSKASMPCPSGMKAGICALM